MYMYMQMYMYMYVYTYYACMKGNALRGQGARNKQFHCSTASMWKCFGCILAYLPALRIALNVSLPKTPIRDNVLNITLSIASRPRGATSQLHRIKSFEGNKRAVRPPPEGETKPHSPSCIEGIRGGRPLRHRASR